MVRKRRTERTGFPARSPVLSSVPPVGGRAALIAARRAFGLRAAPARSAQDGGAERGTALLPEGRARAFSFTLARNLPVLHSNGR